MAKPPLTPAEIVLRALDNKRERPVSIAAARKSRQARRDAEEAAEMARIENIPASKLRKELRKAGLDPDEVERDREEFLKKLSEKPNPRQR